MDPVRLLYADDAPRARTELVRALVGHRELELAAVVVDAQGALDAVERVEADVVLVAMTLGAATIEALAAGGVRVLVVADPPLGEARRVAQATGVRGVLDRTLGPDRLADLIAALGAPAAA